MSIPFIQYLLPDGRRRDISIERDQLTEVKANAILDKGFHFEAEMLRTGDISLTIHDPENEEDVAIEICKNGPEVLKAVDKLILEFPL